MELDASSKLGSKLIQGDPKEQSKNGKLLENVVVDNDLIVVNGPNLCKGVIARLRKTIHNTEESVIVFFILCRRFFSLIISLEIDESRIYSLTKFASKYGNKNMKESDHHPLIMNININWSTSVVDKHERTEIYNLKNGKTLSTFQRIIWSC